MWLDHPWVPYSSSHRPVGTRNAPGKAMYHLINLQWLTKWCPSKSDPSSSSFSDLKASCRLLHKVFSTSLKLQNAAAIKYTGMLHEGWYPAGGHKTELQFQACSAPSNSAKISLCWTGRRLISISVVQKLFALVCHWGPCKHTNYTPPALGSATWMHHQGQSLSHVALSEPTMPLLLHSCLFLVSPQPELHCALSAFHLNPLPDLQPALLN